MKTKHVFWGLFFISLGLIILLNNLGALNWDWYGLWKIWPVIIVVWGISILIKANAVRTILAGLIAILLALAVFASIQSVFGFFTNSCVFSNGDNFGISFNGEYDTTNYQVSYNKEIRDAVLNFHAGAGYFESEDTTSQLIFANAVGKKDNYSMDYSIDDGKTIVNMNMKKKSFFFSHGKNRNKVKLYYNEQPVWDMNYKIGAASIKFDLRNYKIKKLNFDMGAASLRLWVGDKMDETDIDIEAGVSSIRIYIPDSSGCEINTDVTLSSKHFEDFDKIKSGVYRTENFDQAVKKIFIRIDAGVSSIRVKKY